MLLASRDVTVTDANNRITLLGTRRGEHKEARVPMCWMSRRLFRIPWKFIDWPFWHDRCVPPRGGMRAAGRCFYAILLCGCSALPQNREPPARPPSAPVETTALAAPIVVPPSHAKVADKKLQHRVRKTKPQDSAMALEPSVLIGKDPSAVEKLLGSPAGIAQKDVSLVWTYGGPDCVFQVYFYPDIKTSIFHALQFAAATPDGRKVELSHGCIQHLLLARK